MAIYEAMVEAHEQGPDAMNSFIQELSDQLDAYSLGCCGTVDGCDCILSAQRYQSGNVRGIHEKPVQFLRETKRYRVSIDKGLRPKMPLCGHLVLVTTPVVFLMLYYLHGFNPRDAFNQRVWKAVSWMDASLSTFKPPYLRNLPPPTNSPTPSLHRRRCLFPICATAASV